MMYDYYQIFTLILTAIYLLIGGGFIIYVYDSYKKTKQTFLLYLSLGFFFLVVGASIPVLSYTLAILDSAIVVVALVLQIAGLSAIFYSTIK